MAEITLELHSPITEEEWDIIADVDLDNTLSVMFHTKHGKDVEFVKVVRCKDCKWYSQFTSMTGKLLSDGCCEYHSNYFAEDDFCSRGERRENVNSDTDTDDI